MIGTDKKKDENFSLNVGSTYLIRSVESSQKPMITQGIFRGFATIGQETGITIELDDSHGEDKGRLRIIPVPVILAADIVSEERQEEQKKEQPDTVYFG